MKSRRREKKERETALFFLNSIIARVRVELPPEDIEDQMQRWEQFVERSYSLKECDECRRVAPEDYDWLFRLECAPFLDPEKVRELEGLEKRAFMKMGRGTLWTISQRCKECAS